ncbi:MAG: VOC family protein [Caulobacteraceae bacterium]|nr:VOC family protein [Caulobacteraceae bacterium]
MSNGKIAKLGHLGIHVRDLERSKAFYGGILGLAATDMDPKSGATFFSSRPDDEHHEIFLAPGRTAAEGEVLVQQISFRCDTLEDVLAFHKRLKAAGVEIEQIVTHGNAIGIYFFDPDRNRCEIYWDTGLKAKQPFKVPINLDQPVDRIIEDINGLVRKYGETGVRLA